jgi:hypothetical protein
MAQTQSLTTEGYYEMAKLFSTPGGAVTGTGLRSVVCIKTSCTASEAQTYAGITKCTESGVALVNATTVTASTDTSSLNHTFTSGATVTVLGFGCNNDDDDVLYGICCFNAGLALESGDTLAVQMTFQFKAD